MTAPRTTLIGIVGYSPVLECYPLGPRLMSALEAATDGIAGVEVSNLTWGPIHVVQQFQDADAKRPDRVVLIGAAAVSSRPGQVKAYRWAGGSLPDAAVQERVYEAVTGIVDIENTLMIGEYFRIWPSECFTIEADIPSDGFGRMVIADNEGWADDASLRQHIGFSPARTIQSITRLVAALARAGGRAEIALQAKSAEDLAPVGPFIRNFAAETGSDERTQPGGSS